MTPLPAEARLARHLSAARTAWHQRRGTDAATFAPGREALEISGVEAELVFARLANVYPNLETERPGGADCVVGGRAVDVKWSLTGNLLVKLGAVPVDAYVLMRGRYDPAGWMPSAQIGDHYLTDLPGGRVYLVPVADLLPINDLIGGHCG